MTENHMISDPEHYFRQWVPARDPLLQAMEVEALQRDIPIVGPVVGHLLYLLARATRARTILELGTATGYSTIYLARACAGHGGRVVTLEMDRVAIDRASANLQKAGLADRVEVLAGEASRLMQNMHAPFDMIFMDIDKEFYASALPQCTRLLRQNGLMVVDNTAFRDADDFNHQIFSAVEWQCVNLFGLLPMHSPEHDGLCLALRT